MNTCVIGIDPGASGGICFGYADGLATAIKMPDTQGDILIHLRNALLSAPDGINFRCYIEQIPAFMGSDIPQSKIAVMFENYGFTKGVVQALGIPLYQVRPQTWMQALGIGGVTRQRLVKAMSLEERARIARENEAAKREWKRKLKSEAQRRYPSLKITLEKADAILIMDYGLRQLGQPMIATPPAQPALI